MDEGFFLDSVRLRLHEAEIQRERRVLTELGSEVDIILKLADQSFFERISRIKTRTDSLIRFFEMLENVMDDATTEAELTISRISRMLEDARLDPSGIFRI